MPAAAAKRQRNRSQARRCPPKNAPARSPQALPATKMGCEIGHGSAHGQRTPRRLSHPSSKSRQLPTPLSSPSKTPSSTRRDLNLKHSIRRASSIDKLAPRRIRSEKYRRKFLKFKQMASSKPAPHSLASLKTDLALAKLSQEKQAATIRQIQEKLDKAKSRMTSVNAELECPICKEILARPLAVYPCGHIFCEDCLLQTFCTPLPGEEPETTHATRPKQCPDCRAGVHTPPIPVYLVKNLISIHNPELATDESRTNGFGLELGRDFPEGSDPWSILFPDDLADVMTLTSESEAENRSTGSRATRGSHGALEPWDTAVGQLSQSVRNNWVLVADVTPTASEASGDEDDGVESSTSINSDSRVYEAAPYFMGPSGSLHYSSDLPFDNQPFWPSEGSEEEDNHDSPHLMNVDQENDAADLPLPTQRFLMEAYRQFHRVPTPIRNYAWVSRSWEPPAFISEETDDFMTPQERTLHQRGIPLDMQDKFQIAYTNRLGLSVQLGLGNVIFLGWNVAILWTMGDRDGEIFMAYIRWEMRNHPERWNVHLHQDGSWDAHRLRCINTETGDNAYASHGEDGEEDVEFSQGSYSE